MDGQWRFEIDDGDATFSRSGEAKYRANNADYARYTQLMNRMLTGNLSEAEHAELLGLDKKHGGTKKELARRIDTGDATLQDIMQHNALFEAYPEIAETKVKFANIPNGTAGSYDRETNTITIDAKLKYDANEALDVLMHEVQHRVQAAEGFTSGTNPGYWNRAETYDKAAEKYRNNRARLLNGLSAEDRALYNEYRSIDREMGAMFDGSVLYDESRMDTLEKRSDELYKELYGKEWFGKLNRYDRILGDASEAVNAFYWNTAGEIEARDTAARRRMTAEERKNTPPNLGDADTVFADENTTSYSIDENFRKNVDDWVKNTPEDMLSTSPGYFRVGTTSEALQSIGARTDNIYMRKSKIGTIFEDHPEVNVDVIKKVPNILENPVLIMKSITRSDSIVLLSEEKAKNGNSLMVALELTPKPGGRTEAKFSLVTSAYGRADENLRNLINNSELLYLDTNKNRANTWLMQLRVQFPSRQPPYGPIGNIAYAEDGVKITGKKLSELGGVIQKASSGRASVDVSRINNRTAAELRREYERRMQEYQKATQRDDQSYPYIAEMKWIQAAERRLAELGDGNHRRRTVSNTRNDIMKLFSTDKANRKKMEQLINRHIGEMMDSGEITTAALDRMVGELLDNGSVVLSSKNSPWIEEIYERIRSDMRGTKLYVSEKMWGDFGRDEAKLLRQRARKAGVALTRNENDVSPDVRNMELAEKYGEALFPTDIAASDMLRNIIDAAEKGENVKQSPSDRLWDETRTAGADREEAYNASVNDLRSRAEMILREFAEDNKIAITGEPTAPGRFAKAETAKRADFQITTRKDKNDPSGTVTVTNRKTGEKERIYIADAQELSETEMEAYGEKRIREIVKQEAAEAERKEAEAYEAAKVEAKRKKTYEPIQAVGEYTERLARTESALETADTAVMEEGKNRYEARITEEDEYVYAYCGQRKTRFMSIHSSAPQSVGSAAASAVHVQLPVSFFTESSVVEHGQCIIVKTITHAAVFSVQPFASSIPLIAEAESVRFSVPSAI